MKKAVRFLGMLMVGVMLLAHLTVSAGTYKVGDSPMSVEFDDSRWYVFTRDNLEGNLDLVWLGLDGDAMKKDMYDGDIYIYAMLFYEDGSYLDLYVSKWQQEDDWNFLDLSDSELLEVGRNTYEDLVTEDNTSVHLNPYGTHKYFVLEYEYEEERDRYHSNSRHLLRDISCTSIGILECGTKTVCNKVIFLCSNESWPHIRVPRTHHFENGY